LLGDSVEEYTDCVFHWPVKITVVAECSTQTLMTVNQTWWCHKPSQCRDLLNIRIAVQIISLRVIMYINWVNDDEQHYESTGLWASQILNVSRE
jgi:hypothetical protein